MNKKFEKTMKKTISAITSGIIGFNSTVFLVKDGQVCNNVKNSTQLTQSLQLAQPAKSTHKNFNKNLSRGGNLSITNNKQVLSIIDDKETKNKKDIYFKDMETVKKELQKEGEKYQEELRKQQEELKKQQEKIETLNQQKELTSFLKGSKEKIVQLTAYGGEGDQEYKGITRSGLSLQPGTIAVDPRYIPLGSIVYIEGFGIFIASDTGSAVKGEVVDCYQGLTWEDYESMTSEKKRRQWSKEQKQCDEFGRKKGIIAHVLRTDNDIKKNNPNYSKKQYLKDQELVMQKHRAIWNKLERKGKNPNEIMKNSLIQDIEQEK